jgi:hypothetical protein
MKNAAIGIVVIVFLTVASCVGGGIFLYKKGFSNCKDKYNLNIAKTEADNTKILLDIISEQENYISILDYNDGIITERIKSDASDDSDMLSPYIIRDTFDRLRASDKKY